MSVRVLRPMKMDRNGMPKVGKAALKLGVRDCDGDGVSVVTSFFGLLRLAPFIRPFNRRTPPVSLNTDVCRRSTLFSYSNSNFEPFDSGRPISETLLLRYKSVPGQGLVAPRTRMSMDEFDAAVVSTQKQWERVDWIHAMDEVNHPTDY
jgi:hypothetical protein